MTQGKAMRILAVALLALVAVVFRPDAVAQAQGNGAPDPAASWYHPGDSGFIENLGQWNDEALFEMDGSLNVWLRQDGLVYQSADYSAFMPTGQEAQPVTTEAPAVAPPDEPEVNYHAVRANFVGGEPSSVAGLNQLPGYYNWLVGDVDVTHAHKFQTVKYADVYPGISFYVLGPGSPTNTGPDALANSAAKTLYEVAPGANPSDIVVAYEGADSLTLDGSGNLVIGTSLGDITEMNPTAYQMIDGKRYNVAVSFSLSGNEVHFSVGDYDASATLVIDPLVLFAGFGGGTSTDGIAEMHEDATGRVLHGYHDFHGLPDLPGRVQLLVLRGFRSVRDEVRSRQRHVVVVHEGRWLAVRLRRKLRPGHQRRARHPEYRLLRHQLRLPVRVSPRLAELLRRGPVPVVRRRHHAGFRGPGRGLVHRLRRRCRHRSERGRVRHRYDVLSELVQLPVWSRRLPDGRLLLRAVHHASQW